MAQGAWGTGTWDDAKWDSLPLSGNEATGGVGSVLATFPIIVQLTGVQATGAVGNVSPPVPIIYIDDRHDPGPDKLKKQLKREQEKNKKRRDEILAAYERIVEGKIPQEIIAPYVETFDTIKTKQDVTLTDIEKMMSHLDKMQLIWDDHIESDDEEILLL